MTLSIGDVLEIHGAAVIEGHLGRPGQDGPAWIFVDILNAEVDEHDQPTGPVPGPPVLSMAGPVDDVGHLLVGLLNTYSQLTGVPIEEWLGVAAAQPSIAVENFAPDEAPTERGER